MSVSKVITNRNPEETVSGMLVSLLFWLCLLASAVLFASVALSPKLVEFFRLRDVYTINQHKLVAVESQNAQLQRVVDAIQNDKDFANEMTRIEFDAVNPDEEIIPVDAHLKLETRGIETPVVQPAIVPMWYRSWLVMLSNDFTVRRSLLGMAALLVVISFTWLQPLGNNPVPGFDSDSARTPLWKSLRSRYVRSN